MGFSVNSLGRLNIEVGYTVDKSGLNEIKNSLSDLMMQGKLLGPSLDSGMKQAAASAKQLTGMLAAATDPKTGALNMAQLANSFRLTGVSMTQMREGLSQITNSSLQGQQAFATLNKQVLSAQTTFTKTEGIVGQLGKTFMNTFMYSFSYRIVGRFIQGIGNAISYVKDLDKALTNIRIVTKESREEMERFAEKANDAAKRLGVSTKAYTEAALIFTQQGLKGEERDVRTETTMKVANVTGDSAEEVSQNLTAVWNGYKVSSEQAEAAIDKLANVAAHSASNLAELSTGMSKVASAANTMGVSEDQLVSQLATIESVTRQAPESIGTALKTIYARMGDLKVKGSSGGTALGEVSGQMSQLGVNILDQEGNLKEMGNVIEEVAGKWDTWTKAQQQAAAIAMAGKRQYNNLISLFSNWDKYEENMEYSKQSEGQIEAQQQIYLDSIAGIQGKAKAAWEEVYSNMFEGDMFKGIYEGVAGIGNALSSLGDMLPIGAFLALTKIFEFKLIPAVTNFTLGINKSSESANILKLQQDAINNAYKTTVDLDGQRVFTNKEIVSASTQYGALMRTQVGESVSLSRENVALANSTKMRLEIQSGLSAPMQQQFQMLQQQEATQEGLLSKEVSLFTERANLLGLTKEQLNLSNDSITAAAKMVQIYEEQTEPVTTVLGELEAIINAHSGEITELGQIEELLKENSLKIGDQKVALEDVNLTEDQRAAILKLINELMADSTGKEVGLADAAGQLRVQLAGAAGNVSNIVTNINWATQGMQSMAAQAQRVQQLSAAYRGLTSAMFGVSMFFSSLRGFWDTLNDPETSGVEKLTGVMMNLAMVIMFGQQAWAGLKALVGVTSHSIIANQAALIGVAEGYNLALKEEDAQQLINIATREAANGVEKEGIMLKMMEAGCLSTLSNEQKAEIVQRFFNTGALKMEKAGRVGGIFTIKKEIATRIENIKTMLIEKEVQLGVVAVILIAIAVLVMLIAAYANAESQQQKHIKTLQDSQLEAYKTNEALKEMTDRYNTLKDSLSELKDEYATLESLKQGTEQWDEQVIKINGHIAELINKYPQLAQGLTVDENGVFRLSESSMKAVKASSARAIEDQQKKAFVQQANVRENEQVVLADEMSDVVEFFGNEHKWAGALLGDEYSTEMLEAIKDNNIQSISDLRTFLESRGVNINESQVTTLFGYLQQARIKDVEKVNLLKQSAAIARRNSSIDFIGKGKTQQEKTENKKVKEDVYDNWYANAKANYEGVKADFYKNTAPPDWYQKWLPGSGINMLRNAYDMATTGEFKSPFDDGRGGETSFLASSWTQWFDMPWEDTYAIDVLLDGASKKLDSDFNDSLKTLLPEELKAYAPTAKDLGISSTKDFDILTLASQKTGIQREKLDYVNGVGVVEAGKDDEPVSVEFGFEDETKAIKYVETEFSDKVFDYALDVFLKENLDINSLDTKTGRLAAQYRFGDTDVDNYKNVDVSNIHNEDWDTTEQQNKLDKKVDDLNKQIDDLEKKKAKAKTQNEIDKYQDEIDELKDDIERAKRQKETIVNETNTVGVAAQRKIKGYIDETTGEEVKGIYDKWETSVQEAYDTGNIGVAEGNEMNRMVQQVREGTQTKKGKQTKIEEAYSTIASSEDTANEVSAFAQALKGIDWSKPLDVDSIKNSFHEYGLSTDKLNLDWAEIAKEAKKITAQTDDLAGNLEKYNTAGSTYLGLLQGLKPGDTLSNDDFETVLKNSADKEAVKKSFNYQQGKNRWVYLGIDAAGNPDYNKTGLLKATMGTNSKNTITAAKKIRTAFGDTNDNGEGTDIDITADDYNIDYDKKKSEKNDQNYHKTIRTNVIKLIKDAKAAKDQTAYKELETLGGGDYSDLLVALTIEPGEEGSAFNEDGTWVSKDMKDKYNEFLKSGRVLRTGMKNGSFDPAETGIFATAVQVDSRSIGEAYGNIGLFGSDDNEIDSTTKKQQGLEGLRAKAEGYAEAVGGSITEEDNFKKSIASANPELEKQQALLEAVASYSYNLSKGVEKLSSLFNDTYKDVKKGTPEFTNMLAEVAQYASLALGGEYVTPEFVNNHLDLFRRMANGDMAAIKEIQKLGVQTQAVLGNIKLDFSNTKITENKFWSLVDKIQNTSIPVTLDLRTQKFFTDLALALGQIKGMTVGAAQTIFTTFGVATQWADGLNSESDFNPKDEKDLKKNFITKANKMQLPGLNLPGAAAAGKKDSGSNKGNQSNYTYEQIDKNDIDHLHDLKQAMEDLKSTLEKLKKTQDRVIGKSLIKNLDEQNKLIEQQNKNLKNQVNILTKDLGQSQTDMKKLFDFSFTKSGQIKNYKEVLNKRYNAYKDYLTKYNKLSKKQQSGKKGSLLKAKADKAKTIWSEAKSAVSNYDSMYNDRQSKINEMIENFNTISDNSLKKLHAMSDAIKKTNELEQNYLNYEKEILHSEKDRGFQAKYNLATAKLTTKQLKADQKELKTLTKRMEELKKKGWSKKDGVNFSGVLDATAEAAKAYLEDITALQNSLTATIQLSTEAWKDYANELEQVNKKYKSLLDTLKNYEEITKLLYGEDEYQTLISTGQEQATVIDSQLYTFLQGFQQAEIKLKQAQDNYNKDLKKNNGNQDKVSDALKEELDNAENNYQEFRKNVEDTFKNLLDTIKNIYTNTIKQTFKEVNEALTSGYGWETISDSIKRDKQYSDDWLDTSQKIGNIASLTAQFEQEIAKAVDYSASAQQKLLTCKQQELAILEKVDKLTQADIDRAKAKLSLTLKEIALEEARENKSKLRLKRDSQGNYSYQYSTDQEEIAKAKQEYEDARLKLNEDTQKSLFDLINNRQQLEKEASEKISKLYEDLGKARTEDEKENIRKEMSDVVTYYTQQLTHNEAAITRFRGYNAEDNLGYFNQYKGTSYGSVGEVMSHDKDAFNEYLYGSEGVVPMSDTGFKAMNQTTFDWSNKLKLAISKGEKAFKKYQKEVQNVSQNADNSLRKIITGSDNTSGLVNAQRETTNLRNITNTLTSSYNTQATAIQKVITQLTKLYAQYKTEDAQATLKHASDLANNYGNSKANIKKAMQYITKNSNKVIKATTSMSDEAKRLKKNWEGVYKAARKAAKAISNAANGSGYNGPTSGYDYLTNNTTYTKQKAKHKGKKYTIYKGSDGYYYTTSSGGTPYQKPEQAAAAVAKGKKKKTKTQGKTMGKNDLRFDPKDKGRTIVLRNKGLLLRSPGYAFTKPVDQNTAKNMNNGFGFPRQAEYVAKTKWGVPIKPKYSAFDGAVIDKVKTYGGASWVKLKGKKGKIRSWWYPEWYFPPTLFAGFDTGGYTGTWNNKNGRLALLHQKEIVLNKQDTANFLQAVKLTRQFAQDLSKYKTGLVDKITSISNNNKMINTNTSTKNQATQQQINIKASFPNATNSSEIEKAFQQLSAKATQYAWSNKIK